MASKPENVKIAAMQVVKAPDTRLRIQTKFVKKINNNLLETLRKMIDLTLTFREPEGVGLAATQVGLRERYFVGKIANSDLIGVEHKKGHKDQFKAFINPQILSYGKKTKQYFEGCLSIPNIWGETQRCLSIKVSYEDISGQKHQETLKGLAAWIFQHEVDHLDGILFPDRVLEQGGKFYKYTGKDKQGEDVFEEVTI